MNQVAKAPGPFQYTKITEDWHRLDTDSGTYFGRTKEEVMAKPDTEVLFAFAKHGGAADFQLSSGRPAAAIDAEKRIRQALELFNTHPHLQDKMHDISREFTGWSLIARIESQAFIDQSEHQRGVLA